jgi:hypothetical protein
VVTRVIQEYKERAHPNERFHKFFQRVKQVGGFVYQEAKQAAKIEVPACGE